MKCHNPECTNEVPPRSYPGGSPSKWCGLRCKRRVRRAKDRARLRRYRTEHPKAMLAYAKTYYDRSQVQVKARRVLNDAIRSGRMVKGACERKGSDCEGRIEAHHDDYGKPLEVRWLCVRHHAQADAERTLAEA